MTSARQPRLLAVGPNPAWQKVLRFQKVVAGEVNRAYSSYESGGGKGVNFARAARALDAAVTVAYFGGGYTARLLWAELAAAGTRQLTVETASRTRVCTTVICDADGTVTELIEPSGQVSAAEVAELRAAVLAALPAHDGVALCGTAPPGVPPGFYADVAAAARPGGVVLLDACRDVATTLQAGVDILKINRRELEELAGLAGLPAAAAQILRRYEVRFVAVTDGAAPAHLFCSAGARRFRLPVLGSVVNTIGAGDCAAAVLLQRVVSARLTGERPGLSLDAVAAAFAEALAHAAASCLRPVPAAFDPAEAARLAALIEIDEL